MSFWLFNHPTTTNTIDMLMRKMTVRILDAYLRFRAVARYEQIAEAKINFDKSEGLRLGA